MLLRSLHNKSCVEWAKLVDHGDIRSSPPFPTCTVNGDLFYKQTEIWRFQNPCEKATSILPSLKTRVLKPSTSGPEQTTPLPTLHVWWRSAFKWSMGEQRTPYLYLVAIARRLTIDFCVLCLSLFLYFPSCWNHYSWRGDQSLVIWRVKFVLRLLGERIKYGVACYRPNQRLDIYCLFRLDLDRSPGANRAVRFYDLLLILAVIVLKIEKPQLLFAQWMSTPKIMRPAQQLEPTTLLCCPIFTHMGPRVWTGYGIVGFPLGSTPSVISPMSMNIITSSNWFLQVADNFSTRKGG